MIKSQRKEIIKRLIQRKKAEVIKEETYRDYEEGYKKGYITALELLLEENIL